MFSKVAEMWTEVGTRYPRAWWILASATGFALGALASLSLMIAVSFSGNQIHDDDLFFFILVGVGLAVGGIAAAMLQIPVLLRYSFQAKRWGAVNIAGGAVIVVIYCTTGVVFKLIIGDPVGWASLGAALWAVFVVVVVSPIVGGLLGGLQWMVLRPRIGSPDRWVFSNAVGYFMGWVAGTFVEYFVIVFSPISLLWFDDVLLALSLSWVLRGAVFGAVYGLFSRSALTREIEVDAL